MLKIRLQRIGKRGQAYFRVVLLEHTKKPKGEFQELLGSYNPHQKEFKAKVDRIEHWLSRGAQVSPTVNNLLVNYKYWDRPKMTSWKPKAQKQETETKETQAPAKAPAPAEEAETPEGAAPALEESQEKAEAENEESSAEAKSETPTEPAAG